MSKSENLKIKEDRARTHSTNIFHDLRYFVRRTTHNKEFSGGRGDILVIWDISKSAAQLGFDRLI